MSDACLDLTEKLNSIENRLVDIQNKMVTRDYFDFAIAVVREKVEKAQRSIGDFPSTAVASLIVPCGTGRTGNAEPEPILSLQDLIEWFVYRFDEVLGQFEVPIEIEDASPLIEGNQKAELCIPNVAEAIGEMLPLMILSYINTEALLIGMRGDLTMTASMHQQLTITNKTVDAVYDYLGISTDKEEIFLPMGCSVEHQELARFLEPKEVSVGVRKYKEQGITLQEQLTELLSGSAIIRSVFWRKLDRGVSMGLQIANLIKNYRKTEEGMDSREEEDFSDAVREIERGFLDEPGIHDIANPYGKPYSQRPDIKILE